MWFRLFAENEINWIEMNQFVTFEEMEVVMESYMFMELTEEMV